MFSEPQPVASTESLTRGSVLRDGLASAPQRTSTFDRSPGLQASPLQLPVPGLRLTEVSVPQATIRKKLSLLRPRPSPYS